MLSARLRSNQGCWTCRLRRKKCDEQLPTCSICKTLEITCVYSHAKPEWMDGGRREKAKADELKAMVKIKANQRRERRWAAMAGESEGTLAHLTVSDPQQQPGPQPVQRQGEGGQRRNNQSGDRSQSHNQDDQDSTLSRIQNQENDGVLSQALATGMSLDSSYNSDRDMPSTKTATSSVSSHMSSRHSQGTMSGTSKGPNSGSSPLSSAPEDDSFGSCSYPGLVLGEPSHGDLDTDLRHSMIYLDYLVPFLFPFYRPSIVEAGRGWMLALLCKNKALFHVVVSLSNYFFALVLDSVQGGGHTQCRAANWESLQYQQELAITQLKKDMDRLNTRGIEGAALVETLYCLDSIIQLLDFQIAIANTAGWNLHLDAATSLFEQILSHHGSQASYAVPGRPWWTVMTRLGRDFLDATRGNQPRSRSPWSSDQAAFRFFTARLLFTDIVASTATATIPKLAGCHSELLAGDHPLVPLDEFLGCQNWAILAIADIAALASWKKDVMASSSLSRCAIQSELQLRSSAIENQLLARMSKLVQQVPGLEAALEEISKAYSQPLSTDTGADGHAKTERIHKLAIFDPSAHEPHHPSSFFGPSDVVTTTASSLDPRWSPSNLPFAAPNAPNAQRDTIPSPAVALHTLIWAQAAMTYLIVTSFPPHYPTPCAALLEDPAAAAAIADAAAAEKKKAKTLLRASVERTLHLLLSLPSALSLRTLVWAFTVTGVYLTNDDDKEEQRRQRQQLLNLAEEMGPLQVFGTMREAVNVVKNVWSARSSCWEKMKAMMRDVEVGKEEEEKGDGKDVSSNRTTGAGEEAKEEEEEKDELVLWDLQTCLGDNAPLLV